MRARTLNQIVNIVKKRLGGDIVRIEISDETIEEIITESLSIVSQYKPRKYSATLPASSQNGRLTLSAVIIPDNWVVGDSLPDPVPHPYCLGFFNVEMASSTVPSPVGIGPQPVGNPYSGNIFFLGGNINNTVSSALDLWINFEIINFSVSAMRALQGQEFNWAIDENQKASVFFSNLEPPASFITVEAMLEWSIDPYYTQPPANSPDGTPAVLVEPTLTGEIYRLTLDLSLGKCMKAIGEIRNKLLGGNNSTQLNGDRMISDGKELEDKTIDFLQTNADYLGAYAD